MPSCRGAPTFDTTRNFWYNIITRGEKGVELGEYISQVVTEEELSNVAAGRFNILKAPRGWGKTTFMFDDRILNFSRGKGNVLYLIHNTLMRDTIAAANPGIAKVFEGSDFSSWIEQQQGRLFAADPANEDVVHVMCYQTFAALLRKEGAAWLQYIDLIIWDEFDDIRGYYKKDIQQLKRILPCFSEERLAALLQEGKPTSVVNFVYQIKTFVLDPGRIKLIAVSASPERAALYFREYINYILEGRLEEKFAAQETNYIESICGAIYDGTIHKGLRYWCFTPYIHDGFRIETAAQSKGFNPLVLWSERNENWRHLMTPERKEALRCIAEERDLPKEYDLIIITAAGNRGMNIYDTSIQDWICDSTEYEDIQQYMRARFSPARQYLLKGAKGLVDFVQNQFPIDYYEWHTLDELRVLIQERPIFDKENHRLYSFNAAKKAYPDLFERRRFGIKHITQYRIRPA